MNAVTSALVSKRALIAAAGTGGHIFPGLAIAEGLKSLDWQVVWLGTKAGMENRIVPEKKIQLESIEFSGVRGKGFINWVMMPFKLVKATIDCCLVVLKTKPDVVITFGGYVSIPTGLAAKLLFKTLVIHEQNSVVGLSNKVLSHLTKYVFTAFPNVIKNAVTAGNPLRSEFINITEPQLRFQNRTGPLRILVLGGSLGAKFLNETVPAAVKLLPDINRPLVMHQTGADQLSAVQDIYFALNVEATVVAFIDNTAEAFADADLIICRAGASTVTELTAVGAAAIFVPLPSAVDDHQTSNAKYLVNNDAAWLLPQSELTPEKLANHILKMNRIELLGMAKSSKKLNLPNAVNIMVQACKELTA
jgi:UDP-N-acetylglucosamine--N-acetylmuramyl-(pentapeptide) pyrophosphoryl-undecaprenol N-acetylglucosamine transferase